MSTARVVAAIDFGTHGTGFAWAFTSEQDREPAHRRINFFDEWAGQPTNYVKNLSALLLDGSGTVVGWGHEGRQKYLAQHRVRVDLEYYERFKMNLIEEPVAGRRTRDLITGYLSAFYEFALQRIIAGSGVTEDEILWCLTVPAIWRDRERQAMRECAARAGLPTGTRLLIAVEPEVAALYCSYEESEGEGAGDRFMVVDAGGGTVDITAYERVDRGLNEIGYTSGGSHGSTYIDRHLVDGFLTDQLGAEFVARCTELEPGSFVALLAEWERAKRSYDPDRPSPVTLALPYRLIRLLDDRTRTRLADRQGGIDDEVVLSAKEVQGLFDHAVEPTLTLVDQQLQRIGGKSVDRVLLVGGFAQSRYLQNRLRQRLPARTRLIVPARPAWAVLLGAVHYGLDPTSIRGRRSRFSYGVGTAAPFDDARDPAHLRFTDHQGRVLCFSRFDVFVHADEVVEPGRSVGRTYIPVRPHQPEMTLAIYTSEDVDPRYTTEPSCREVGQMTVDLAGSPAARSLTPEQRVVEVTLSFGGTEIEAKARDVRTGVEVGTRVQFETGDPT